MNTSAFFETVEKVFHDWTYDHPRVLYSLIRALKPKVVVEVGTYRGYAACYMARALQENNSGHLYCIDNLSLVDHAGRYGDPVAHWNDNLVKCGVRDWVTLKKGNSDDQLLWPTAVDFAYIDGWHSYLMARNDFNACAARGADCICLDDTLNCIGPRMVVSQLDRDQWDVLTLPNDNGLTICHNKVVRRITFSQERENHPGTVLTDASDDDILSHLEECAVDNYVNYSDFNWR